MREAKTGVFGFYIEFEKNGFSSATLLRLNGAMVASACHTSGRSQGHFWVRFSQLLIRTLLPAFFLAVLPFFSLAQDPFYTQFANAESFFNPALTGYRGALSIIGKYKSQWHLANVSGFQTSSLAVEESMPCSPFDYGLHLGFDREGEGLLQTTDFGIRGAGTIAWDIGVSSHNLRLGLGMIWAAKRVDYNRLVFSDQLDPKYGAVDANGIKNPTLFVPFNDGRSLWFFTPALGFTHRILLNRQRFRSPTIHYGAAIHNAFSIGDQHITGNVESILDQNTKIPVRFHLFFTTEFVMVANGRSFISMRPMAVYQRQGPISYYELGNRVSLNRNLALGLYYHFNFHKGQQQPGNTNWYAIQAEVGGVMAKTRRIDVGFSYAGNFSGLRNSFGPIFELSLGFHFAASPSCQLLGYKDEVPYGDHIKCPTSSLTPGRKKMYEGLWYQ